MSAYLAFLSEWYNVPWLVAAAVGVLLAVAGPRRHLFSPSALAIAAGVTGLTLNGAIHDLRLGAIGPRFPIVALLSLVVGLFTGWFAPRLRDRIAPPVTGVTFNRPDLAGSEAVVLSARVGEGGDAVGRARHRDDEGVSHIVRIRLEPDGAPASVSFGTRVRLERFDAAARLYLARPADAATEPDGSTPGFR
ncbi:MAG: hypothetical protein ACODAA_04565 [Gemmatimonadota bacterium]